MIGTSLGPYKIIEQLGAGGMGEVYLGEDTRLGRKVAIKVLPEEYASDPERLARFEQEARAAAALNHPHIAVVHDVGSETGDDGTITHFMVQEYLEGDTLREPLNKGALPLEQTLSLATEIAEALTAAHAAGIVHRDLKPENIFITKEGHAKVLDFGLAKLMEMAAPVGGEATMSPTMLGTVAGQVMGTAGYMAPEQVNGEEADHRADLFAFGSVLYESVTGRRAFAGKSIPDTLSRILHDEPGSLVEVDASLPLELQRIVKKCLAKEREKRYQTAGDLVVDLQALRADVEAGTAVGVGASGRGSAAAAAPGLTISRTAAGMIGVALVAALSIAWVLWPRPKADVIRLDVTLPAPLAGGGSLIAMSPDGERVVYVDNSTGVRRLMQRRLGVAGAGTPIPGTEGTGSPFFSPDSREIGFWANGDLKAVDLDTDQQRTIAEDCCLPGTFAAWSPDGTTIVFSNVFSNFAELRVVAAAGGEPSVLLEVGGEWTGYGRPDYLPGGDAVVVELIGREDQSQIGVIALSPQPRIAYVGPAGGDPSFAPTGHIVYAAGGTLYGLSFDAGSLQPTGPPAPVQDRVRMRPGGAAQFAFSDTGTLAFAPGGATNEGYSLAWLDRNDDSENIDTPELPGSWHTPRLSPNGERVALGIDEAATITRTSYDLDIYIYDFDAGTMSALVTEGSAAWPVWSADGESVYFSWKREDGDYDIYRKQVGSGADPVEILVAEGDQIVTSLHPNESVLLYDQHDDSGARDSIWALTLDGSAAPLELVDEPDPVNGAVFSPTGDAFAYEVGETDQSDVWVQAYPGPDPRRLVAAGFAKPAWSPPGAELFFLSPGPSDFVWSAAVTLSQGRFDITPAEALIDASFLAMYPGRDFDIGPEGRRVLFALPGGERGNAPAQINVVLNWFEELKQRVPTGR